MKICILYIKLIAAISVTPFVLGLPTEEETARNGKNMAPVMQTILMDIAKELISRSASNSQVLTLNVTNLLVLLLLKGLLWGASFASTYGHPKTRSEEGTSEPYLTETEILLLLSYLMSNDGGDFQCLHRVACEDPKKAKEYVNAAKIIINAVEFLGINSTINEKYQNMLNQLGDAIQFREDGGICEGKYSCLRNTDNDV